MQGTGQCRGQDNAGDRTMQGTGQCRGQDNKIGVVVMDPGIKSFPLQLCRQTSIHVTQKIDKINRIV